MSHTLNSIAVKLSTVALALSLGSPALAQKQQLSESFSVDPALLAAAQKEGKVVFWCSLRAQECAVLTKRFEELTKVKTEVIRVSTGPALTRLSQERTAGIHSVDVLSHSDQSVWNGIYKEKKWLVQYTPEGARSYDQHYKDPDGYYYAHFLIANGIGLNTQHIKGNDVPTGYADLLDPKYKGKIVMPHPNYSGGFAETVAILYKLMGPDFFKKLKQNDVMVKAGSQFTLNPIVATGERQLAIQGTDALFITDAQQGKPVDIVYPKEGTIVNAMFTGLVADAPNPNAGKLLLEWIHSAESQSAVAADNWLVPHPQATYPKGRKTLKDIQVLTLSPEEAKRIPEVKRDFADIFGG